AAGQPERQECEHRGDVPDTPPGTPAAPASGVGADPAHDRFHLPPRRHHGDGVRVPGTPRDQPSKARTPEAVVGTRRLFVYSCPSASAIRPSVVSEVNQTRTPLRDLRTRLHRLRTRLRSLRSRAFDLVTHDVGAGVGGSRTVTARIYLGQLDRLSPLRRPDGTRTDPGQHEPRLTFEEPMRPHPTGRTALGRVLG